MALNWSVAVLLAFIQVCVGTPWATPAQEALDEIHDAEIFRAVVSSMEQWQRRHNTTSHHRRKRAESQVCYDNLGCFQDSGPYGYLDMLPSTPEDVGTRFLLYASHTTAEPAHDVPFANITQVWAWAETSFNRSAPTKVIVHGFGSDCDHVWVYEMKSALMAVEACNVICVDWGHGAAVPNYVKASANTRLVGKQVALLLGGLQARGLDLLTTHVIGFSLGAHVAGFAGAQLKNLSRITGLDPAGPLFESQDPRARLDSSDAMFVDVIHSNGENLILGGLGSWQPMGHVDFYPNGGRMQKGCSNLFVGAVTDILWSATEVEGRSLCNHRRAYKFFTDSLSPRCHFPAFPCESYDKFLEGACFPCAGDKRCGNMGYYADKSTVRGTLFLITRDEEPFCAHQYHVRVESAPSTPPVVSYGKMQITLVGSADINETFTLTQKDDAEIRVGVPLTRIAVPHPALQEPRSVQLTYTAYSGWLSSGLAKWTIDKLTLTDSFGKSLSVCKKGLNLDSGVPVTLPLYPGECNPPRTAANTTAADAAPPTNKTTSTFTSLLDIFRYKPTPVVQIGDDGSVAPSHPPIPPVSPEFNPKVTTTIPSNSKPIYGVPTSVSSGGNTSVSTYFVGGSGGDVTSSVSLLDIAESVATGLFENKPWRPVEPGIVGNTNSLVDRDIHEDSRAFNDEKVRQFVANETAVDDARGNASVVDLGTMFNVGNRSDVYVMVGEITTNRPEIKEPVLLATRRMAEGGDRNSSVFRPRAISVEGHAAEVFTTPRPEIKEPILDPTTPKSEKRRAGAARGTAEWMPRQDLKPPAMDASWRYWDRKDDEPSPFDEWQRGGDVTREKQSVTISRASPRIDGVDETKRNDTTSASENGNTTSYGAPKRAAKQITVQLFPQRLAAFLLQAERFARQQLLPFAKQNQSFSSSSNVQKIATTSRRFSTKDDSVQRKAKLFFDNANRNGSTPTGDSNFNRNGSQPHDTDHKQIKTVHIADAMTERDKFTSFDIVYREGGLKSDDASPSRNTDAQTGVLVPYSYHTNNRNQKYIPLQYTDETEDRGTEHE